jgi:hypothetical protein
VRKTLALSAFFEKSAQTIHGINDEPFSNIVTSILNQALSFRIRNVAGFQILRPKPSPRLLTLNNCGLDIQIQNLEDLPHRLSHRCLPSVICEHHHILDHLRLIHRDLNHQTGNRITIGTHPVRKASKSRFDDGLSPYGTTQTRLLVKKSMGLLRNPAPDRQDGRFRNIHNNGIHSQPRQRTMRRSKLGTEITHKENRDIPDLFAHVGIQIRVVRPDRPAPLLPSADSEKVDAEDHADEDEIDTTASVKPATLRPQKRENFVPQFRIARRRNRDRGVEKVGVIGRENPKRGLRKGSIKQSLERFSVGEGMGMGTCD